MSHDSEHRPGSKPVKGLLTVTMHECHGLLRKAYWGKQDPYVKLKLDEEAFRTKSDMNAECDPVWDQTFLFNVDCYDDELFILKVKDDNILTDRTLGRFALPLAQLLSRVNKRLKYQLVDDEDYQRQAGVVIMTVEWKPANSESAISVAPVSTPAITITGPSNEQSVQAQIVIQGVKPPASPNISPSPSPTPMIRSINSSMTGTNPAAPVFTPATASASVTTTMSTLQVNNNSLNTVSAGTIATNVNNTSNGPINNTNNAYGFVPPPHTSISPIYTSNTNGSLLNGPTYYPNSASSAPLIINGAHFGPPPAVPSRSYQNNHLLHHQGNMNYNSNNNGWDHNSHSGPTLAKKASLQHQSTLSASSSSSSASASSRSKPELKRTASVSGKERSDSVAFDDAFEVLESQDADSLRLEEVRVWCDRELRGLQQIYMNSSIASGRIEGIVHGVQKGGAAHTMILSQNEYITKVEGKKDDRGIHSLVVTTNIQRKKFTASHDGEAFELNALPGHEIIGFYGTAHGPTQKIISLGAYLRPLRPALLAAQQQQSIQPIQPLQIQPLQPMQQLQSMQHMQPIQPIPTIQPAQQNSGAALPIAMPVNGYNQNFGLYQTNSNQNMQYNAMNNPYGQLPPRFDFK